jgi:hypothetical protein
MPVTELRWYCKAVTMDEDELSTEGKLEKELNVTNNPEGVERSLDLQPYRLYRMET